MSESKVPKEVQDALKKQRQAFHEKFGRYPGPDDPVFFDPNASEPRLLDGEQMELDVAAIMQKADADPAMIHAWRKTGMIVTDMNSDQFSAVDLAEWQDAIDEYNNGRSQPPL